MSAKLRRAADLGYRWPMRIVARCARVCDSLAPRALAARLRWRRGRVRRCEGPGRPTRAPGAATSARHRRQTRPPRRPWLSRTAATCRARSSRRPRQRRLRRHSASAAPPKGPHAHEVGRGPEDIRAIIMARRDDARACYDAALKDHPGIEGDLVIAWTIDPKGNVTQTSLDGSRSQIVEPTVVACVSDIIKKVQFAASPGGYETRAFYPFNFHPHHGSSTPHPLKHGSHGDVTQPAAVQRWNQAPTCAPRSRAALSASSSGARRPPRRRVRGASLPRARRAARTPAGSTAVGVEKARRDRARPRRASRAAGGRSRASRALHGVAQLVRGMGEDEPSNRGVKLDASRRPGVLGRLRERLEIERAGVGGVEGLHEGPVEPTGVEGERVVAPGSAASKERSGDRRRVAEGSTCAADGS